MAKPIYKNKGAQQVFIEIEDDAGKKTRFDTSVYIDADPDYSPFGKFDSTLSDPRLPTHYKNTNFRITWFINFGVNGPKNEQNSKKLQKAYKVTIQKAPSGKTLCIYDDTQAAGQEVRVLGPGGITYTENSNGTISFYLDLVDPPAGYYP